jgi:hypothetical protein
MRFHDFKIVMKLSHFAAYFPYEISCFFVVMRCPCEILCFLRHNFRVRLHAFWAIMRSLDEIILHQVDPYVGG